MRLGTTEDIENKYLTVHRRNQFIYSGFFISNTYFFPLSNCYFWGIPSPPHWNRQQQTYARFFFFAFLSSIPFLLVTRFLGKGREKKMGSWHHLREKKRGRGDFRRFGGFFRGVGVCVCRAGRRNPLLTQPLPPTTASEERRGTFWRAIKSARPSYPDTGGYFNLFLFLPFLRALVGCCAVRGGGCKMYRTGAAAK